MSEWNPNKVRLRIHRNLTAIVDMYGRLEDAATEAGKPEGEAVMLLGNVANIEAFNNRLDAAKDTSHAADQVEHDVLLILATWEDAVREELDRPTDLRATVDRAADFLRSQVDWMLGEDEHGNLQFLGIDQLDTDLSRCRTILENVLHEGYRPDLGVPCVDCSQPLRRVWVNTNDDGGPATEYDDRWECRPCDIGYSHAQYLNAVHADYLANADWLTAADIQKQWRVPTATVRQWHKRSKVGKRKNSDTGRTEYRVSDVLRARDTEDARQDA